MLNKTLFVTAIAVFSASAVSGCNNFLIAGKHTPDEMAVVDAAPLSLPPNFDLRPPRTKGEVVATTRDASSLFWKKQPERKVVAEDISKSESWLLEKAGAEERNENIKEILAMENPTEEQKIAAEMDRVAGEKTAEIETEAEKLLNKADYEITGSIDAIK